MAFCVVFTTVNCGLSRVVFEQKPVGGSKVAGLPHPSLSPFPPIPFPFHSVFRQTSGREGQIQWGGSSPASPYTNTTLGLRPSVLGHDRSQTKIIGLGLGLLVGLVLFCEKNDLVTLVVIMILKDTATFHVLFIVSLFCAWNTTTAVEINSGVHFFKLNPPSAFVYSRLSCLVIHAEHVVHSAWILFWLWMFVCMFVCLYVC